MNKSLTWSNLRKKILADPKVKKAYADLDVEFEIIEGLIRLRSEKKITQQQLAEKVDTTQSVIARLESGNANPTIGFLKRIADALEVPLTVKLG